MKKELRKLAETAEQQGWVVKMTNSCHYKFIPPRKTEPILFTSSTPSDFKAWKNFRKQLQRHGLKL